MLKGETVKKKKAVKKNCDCDLPAGDAIYDADQKLQQGSNTIDTSQLIIFGYATQYSCMRNKMSAQ